MFQLSFLTKSAGGVKWNSNGEVMLQKKNELSSEDAMSGVVPVCARQHTKTFGRDSTALQRVDGPVIVLQSVHQLQDSAHAADGGVDGGSADELRG